VCEFWVICAEKLHINKIAARLGARRPWPRWRTSVDGGHVSQSPPQAASAPARKIGQRNEIRRVGGSNSPPHDYKICPGCPSGAEGGGLRCLFQALIAAFAAAGQFRVVTSAADDGPATRDVLLHRHAIDGIDGSTRESDLALPRDNAGIGRDPRDSHIIRLCACRARRPWAHWREIPMALAPGATA
jgi:hypothetical protein